MGDKGRQDPRREAGRQGETKPREGGHTIQQRDEGEKLGDKLGGQLEDKLGDKLGRPTHYPTKRSK